LRDQDGLFRHWYLMLRRQKQQVEGLPDLDKVVYCEYFATSEDGIRWDYPVLNKVPSHQQFQDKTPLAPHAFLGSGQLDAAGRELCGISGPEGFCVIDSTMTPHPQARGRFTAMYLSSLGDGLTDGYNGKTGGLCFAWSDNGIDWNAYPENPVIRGWMDTNNCFFYDPKIGKYVIYGRPNVHTRLGSHLTNRFIARTESDDLIHWSPYKTVLDTDDRDADPLNYLDEAERQQYWDTYYKTARKPVYNPVSRGRSRQFYGILVYPYYDLYIGIAQMYDVPTGEMWLELCHSYDGVEWHREAAPVPFIAPRKGEWDCGMVSSATCSPPVQVDDEIYMYYSGANYNHHQYGLPMNPIFGIGLRKLQRDRYIGYRAGEQEGELITVPFARPDQLRLNAAIEVGGEIRVEMFGAYNEPIAGYGLDDCVVMRQGDGLALDVQYNGNRKLGEAELSSVRFRIRCRRAIIYGLELSYDESTNTEGFQ
jgi:hypothetical protein